MLLVWSRAVDREPPYGAMPVNISPTFFRAHFRGNNLNRFPLYEIEMFLTLTIRRTQDDQLPHASPPNFAFRIT